MSRFAAFFLALGCALVLSWQAHAAHEVSGSPLTWYFADSDCVDLYDTPTPPGGALDFSAPANWPVTLSTAYNLQLNRGAATQISGSPDGMCDEDPGTLKGTWSIGASQNLWIGPVTLPPAGWVVIWDFTSIGTIFQMEPEVKLPWYIDISQRTHSINTLTAGVRGYYIGPRVIDSVLATGLAGSAAHTEGETYLEFTSAGAATYTTDIIFMPVRDAGYGR